MTIGPVLIPLLQAARLSPVTIGAALLLGSSIGGELFNPGTVEWQTLTNELKVPATMAIARVTPYLLLHLGVALALFWWLSARAEARRDPKDLAAPPAPPDAAPVNGDGNRAVVTTEERPFRVNLLKAAVPLVPVVLLFLAGPPLVWLKVDRAWLIGVGEPPLRLESRLIGAAMLVGSIAAALVSPRQAAGTAQAFFEGAGHAFARIVSVIVVANCFGKGMEAIGVREQFAPDQVRAPIADAVRPGLAAAVRHPVRLRLCLDAEPPRPPDGAGRGAARGSSHHRRPRLARLLGGANHLARGPGGAAVLDPGRRRTAQPGTPPGHPHPRRRGGGLGRASRPVLLLIWTVLSPGVSFAMEQLAFLLTLTDCSCLWA